MLCNRKRRPAKFRPLLSLSTSCGLLGLQPQGLASLGQMFHQIKFSKISCCCLFYDVHLIMLDSTQLDTELEIWDLLHHKIWERWNLSKIAPKFFESSSCSKIRKSGSFCFKDFEDFGPTVASANIPKAPFHLNFIHPLTVTFFFLFLEFKTSILLERAVG